MSAMGSPKWRSAVARWLILALAISGLVLIESKEPAPAQASGQCIEFMHSSVFYYDKKQMGANSRTFDARYLAYKFTPTNSDEVKVELSFQKSSGTRIALAASQPSSQLLGLVTSASPKTSFFLVQLLDGGGNDKLVDYTEAQVVDTATVTVRKVSDNSVLCQSTQQFTAKSTLAANANKIYSAKISSNFATVATESQVVITVTGNTGTIGAGPDGKSAINLTPVASITSPDGAFNAAAWELKRVEYKGLSSACQKIPNTLYFDKSSTPSSLTCAGNYIASYLFEVRSNYNSAESVNSKIQSFIYAASGNLIKHTTPASNMVTLPKADKASTNKPTVANPENLDVFINDALASLPFTAADLSMTTVVGTPGNTVSSAVPTYVNASGSPAIQWEKTCIVNSGVCYTNSPVLITGKGTWSVIDGLAGTKVIRFVPASGYYSNDPEIPETIEFRLTDGTGAVATASANVIINNTGLVAQDTSFKTPPDTASSSEILIGVGASIEWDSTKIIDLAGAAVTSAVDIPDQGRWEIIGGAGNPRRLQFTPISNFSGTSFIQFELASSTLTARATAYATTDPKPSITAESATKTMDSDGASATLSPTLTPADVANKCLYASEATSASCTTSANSSSLSWTLQANGQVSFRSLFGFTGSAVVYYKVVDSNGNVATNSMTVTVNQPAAPTITAETGSGNTAAAVTLSPTITSTLTTTVCLVDPSDESSCQKSVTTGQGTWVLNGNNTITFTSLNSFTGSATISAKVTDSINQTGTATQTVTVNAPAAPTVSSPSGTTAANTQITVSVTVTNVLPVSSKCLVDPSDSTSCSDSVTIPGKGKFTRVNDQVRFEPAAGFTGSATVSFRVTDSLGQSSSGTVTINVTDDPGFNANAVTVVTTSPATSVTQTTATLNGSVAAGNVTVNITFCYSTSPSLSGCITVTATPASLNGGASSNVSAGITGLTGSTTYYYRVIGVDGSTFNGATVSFTTTAAPANNSDPAPTTPSEPCEPGVTTSSVDAGLYSKLIGFLVSLLSNAGSFGVSVFDGIAKSPFGSAVSSTMAPNPLWSQAGYEALTSDRLVMSLQAAGSKATPKTLTEEEKLTEDDISLVAGSNPGEVEISSNDDEPLSVLSVSTLDDPFSSTEFSGADFNKPEVWELLGYGQLCWKLEPFGDTDLAYVLPNPIKLPAGTAAGNWRYSTVIVKAGSLTARSDTYQTDTIFPAPAPGSVVWPDVNANGVLDPGGRGGDKAISHIIFCVTNGLTPTQTPQSTISASATTSPTPTQTTTAPTQSSTATPTPTATQTSTPTPSQSTSTPVPTQTTATPTPTATQTSTPTPTTNVSCPTPTSTATIAPRGPAPTESPKVVFKLNNLIPSPTPTPTPTQTSNPSPSQTQTPTPTNTSTPTPTQTSTPNPSSTPTPTSSSTPTQSPTPTSSATPAPTQTQSPAPTATPSPTFTPRFTELGEQLCEPNQPNGVAMVLSNGLDRLCYQTTTLAFFRAASVIPADLEEIDPQGELAQTGFDSIFWLVISGLLAVSGAMMLMVARRKEN